MALLCGINNEVIERAKATWIDTSVSTEQILKSITYQPKGESEDDVIEAWDNFFPLELSEASRGFRTGDVVFFG